MARQNFCGLHGNTDVPCPECRAFTKGQVRQLTDTVSRQGAEITALIRERDEARAELADPRNSSSGPKRYWRERAERAEVRVAALTSELDEARELTRDYMGKELARRKQRDKARDEHAKAVIALSHAQELIDAAVRAIPVGAAGTSTIADYIVQVRDERDAARADAAESRRGWELAEADINRLRALLRAVRQMVLIADAPQDVIDDWLARIDAALEGRQNANIRAEADPEGEVAQARAEAEWVLHNAGLLHEWAQEWYPDRHPPLIRWLRDRMRAARAAEEGRDA